MGDWFPYSGQQSGLAHTPGGSFPLDSLLGTRAYPALGAAMPVRMTPAELERFALETAQATANALAPKAEPAKEPEPDLSDCIGCEVCGGKSFLCVRYRARRRWLFWKHAPELGLQCARCNYKQWFPAGVIVTEQYRNKNFDARYRARWIA